MWTESIYNLVVDGCSSTITSCVVIIDSKVSL